MNFITRNLGWILLLIFFLFMLFIISSNGTKNVADNNASGATVSGALVEGEDDLDNLVKKIDENGEDIVEGADEPKKKKGFFASIFGKTDINSEDKKSESHNESEKDAEEEKASEKDADIKEEKKGIFSKLFSSDEDSEEEKEDTMVITKPTAEASANLMKDSKVKSSHVTKELISQYAPEIYGDMYPGLDLETQIGNTYEVGVFSLKLNNAYFNETIAFMLKGDRVKQMTKENVYGCFMVEVTNAQNLENVGKTGYVCKKYLQETTGEFENNQEEEAETIVDTPSEKIEIGQVISIEKEIVVFGDGIQLHAGDKVDALTASDANGCFLAHVFEAAVMPNVVPVGKICLSDIK